MLSIAYLKITIAVLVLICSIVGIIKLFRGKQIIKLHASYGTHPISIPKAGYYSLWAEAKFMTKLPLANFNSTISDIHGKPVRTYKSIFRPRANSMSQATVQLKYFYLKQGEYVLNITNEKETTLNVLDKIANNFLPEQTEAQFSYRIKNTFPEFLFPVFMIALMFAVQGIVFTLIDLIPKATP
ncbi:MAG: hypothetical protein LBE34_11930 [Flavobacteriaceae bacterium]|jgi:hypothetical protein|nr:hypothetical protein [Flavobacteriaceae bacterium]